MSEVKKNDLGHHVDFDSAVGSGSGRGQEILRRHIGGGSWNSRLNLRRTQEDSDIGHLRSNDRSSARSRKFPLQALRHRGGNWTPYPRRRSDPIPEGSIVSGVHRRGT
jgi:hypothetical protein